jgi:hypothetical protein
MSVSRPDLNGAKSGGKKRTRQRAQAESMSVNTYAASLEAL